MRTVREFPTARVRGIGLPAWRRHRAFALAVTFTFVSFSGLPLAQAPDARSPAPAPARPTATSVNSTSGRSSGEGAPARQTPVKREASASKPAPAGSTAVRQNTTKSPSSNASRRTPTLKIDLKQAARDAAAASAHPGASSLSTTSASSPVFVPANGKTGPAAAFGPALSDNVRRNLYGPASPQGIEMGDRPPGSTSLCGDGSKRRFAEVDPKTAAAMLPDLPALRPRTICARRSTVIADYVFR